MKKLVFYFSIFVCSVVHGQADRSDYQIRKNEAIEWAQLNDQPVAFEIDGSYYELQYLGPNNHPVYYKTFNASSAYTTEISYLYDDSYLGTNLSGKGVPIGVWDGGGILVSHQELQSKTSQKDNPNNTSNHATHVVGTILATGINPEAKGMAYGASSSTYDFNADDPEMKDAAANGLILSNHSYGSVLGWNFSSEDQKWTWFGDAEVSDSEDYRFGLYNQDAFVWDEIAYENLDYLIVKSAGNDRSDSGNGTRPADGPFDIIGPQGCAKNILTVGAISAINKKYENPSDVVMSSFSSWGPTDDGRIKPDIVGMGVNVLSTGAGGVDNYITLSGTSMSAPNVTGGLALIQELNHNMHGHYLKNYMLKGLAIHTALEAGPEPGPDYAYGWGLFSGKNAAVHLMNTRENGDFQTIDDSIANGDVKVYNIEVPEMGSIKVSICWTDVPGSPINEAVLDPSNLNLVNDLDLRLVGPNDNTYLPWKMDPISKKASKGDNFRDNVEKLEESSLVKGQYTIKVAHKGDLESTQKYGLFITVKDSSQQVERVLYYTSSNNILNQAGWSLNPDQGSGLIPNDKDIVVLDDLTMSKSLELTDDLKVKSFIVNGNEPMEINLQGHTIEIENNLAVSNANTVIRNGSLVFSGDVNSLISMSGNLENIDVVSTRDLQLHLIDDANRINLKSLRMTAGSLNIKNNQLKVDSIFLTNSSLICENGLIESSYLSIDEIIGQVTINNSGDAVINISNASEATLNLSGGIFDINISNYYYGNIYISNGSAKISGNIQLDTLTLIDIETFELGAETTLNIAKDISVNNSSKNTTIYSSEESAFFSSSTFNKRCLGSVDMTNVDAIGTSKFVLGMESTLTNSEGWIIDRCEDVIDAKFEYEYVCKNGVTKFYDTSDGEILDWFWDFGVENIDSDTSNVQNAEFSFSSDGIFECTLRVIDVHNDTSFYRQNVNIVNGTLGQPTLKMVDGALVTSAFGNTYKWYYNGELLESKNESSLSGDLQPGYYYIEIYNNTCMKRSEPFLLEVLGAIGSSINLFPNPTDGLIRLNGLLEGVEYTYQLFDLSGKVIVTGMLNSNEDEISLDNLEEGVYLIKIENEYAIHSSKIIIRN